MKVFEYAKEKGIGTAKVLETLGDSERSHMTALTEDEILKLDAELESDAKQEEVDTKALVEQLTEEIKDLKHGNQALVQREKDNLKIIESQKNRIEELEEELDLLGSGAPAVTDKSEIAKINAECAELTKDMSADEIEKIKTNLDCMGTKSKYWDKYSILRLQK